MQPLHRLEMLPAPQPHFAPHWRWQPIDLRALRASSRAPSADRRTPSAATETAASADRSPDAVPEHRASVPMRPTPPARAAKRPREICTQVASYTSFLHAVEKTNDGSGVPGSGLSV